jgi:signal transduction histidine kinase
MYRAPHLLRQWTVCFPDEEERLFLRFHSNQNHLQVRWGTAFLLVAWISFGIGDVIGFPSLLAELSAIRFGLVAPVLGWQCWGLFRRSKGLRRRIPRYLPAVPAALNLGLLLMMGRAYGEDPQRALQLFWPLLIGLRLLQYSLLGLRCRTSTALGLAGLILILIAGLVGHMESGTLITILVQLAAANLLGILVSARLEVGERREFRFRRRYRQSIRASCKGRSAVQETCGRSGTECVRVHAAAASEGICTTKPAEVFEEKERFLFAAYHDLQQPLSVIGLYVRAARNKLKSNQDASLHGDLAIIEGAGQDIAEMFKGVRDVLTVGNTGPALEPVDLAALLEEIDRELRDRAERKGLALCLFLRPCDRRWIWSDRALLKRALSNLVSNAVAYTERGRVTVHVVDLGGRVRIDVEDTGIGIPEAFHARIFDDYFRIGTPGGSGKPGLGLGLAIVRRIARALPSMCWRIWRSGTEG